MFQGTPNNREYNQWIPVRIRRETHFSIEIAPREYYTFLHLKNGCLILELEEKNFYIEAPAAVCLDERIRVRLQSERQPFFYTVDFRPEFLNVNMKLSLLRNKHYGALCEQHAFFQLSPFLSEDAGDGILRLSPDTLDKMERSARILEANLRDQADWYWSCRARSYFIDIISLLERIFHHYYMEEAETVRRPALTDEFKRLVEYINNHLDMRHTLDSLYACFRINKNQIETMFRETLGVTFHDYLQKRRFEEAAYYLRFTKLDGGQIASRIGLSSSQNFSRFFHAASGQTPTEFRQNAVDARNADAGLEEKSHPVPAVRRPPIPPAES